MKHALYKNKNKKLHSHGKVYFQQPAQEQIMHIDDEIIVTSADITLLERDCAVGVWSTTDLFVMKRLQRIEKCIAKTVTL